MTLSTLKDRLKQHLSMFSQSMLDLLAPLRIRRPAFSSSRATSARHRQADGLSSAFAAMAYSVLMGTQASQAPSAFESQLERHPSMFSQSILDLLAPLRIRRPAFSSSRATSARHRQADGLSSAFAAMAY